MEIRPTSAGGALAFAVVVFLAAPRTTAVSPMSGRELEVQVVANDPVVEWHQIFNAATLATVPVPNSLTTSRSAALVSVSVFDAINAVDRWYAPYLVTRPRTCAHFGERRRDSGGLRDAPEALSSTGDGADDAPGRLDRSIDGRRACRICGARSLLGRVRSRYYLVSTPERWIDARDGAVHGLCNPRLLETDSARELFRQRTSVCDDDSLGTRAAVPVPACATAGPEQSGVCGRFQRNQDLGCGERLAPPTGRLRIGGVLER